MAWKSPSRAISARFWECERSQGKGQQADLVLLETCLELDAEAIERLLDLGDCSRNLRRRELTREPDA
jgi:hypothetical protein